jgi:aspartate aminotransferase
MTAVSAPLPSENDNRLISAARLAGRMGRIGDSATAAMSGRAAGLIAEGNDIIVMSEGEMDFDTPEHIARAGVEAILNGATRYTAVSGTPSLKAAIRQKFLADQGLRYEDDEVIASAGAKQVIFNAMLATLSPGDEVVIPVPSWVSYPDIVRFSEGVPKLIQCHAADAFRLTPDVLRASLGPRTKWLILNSPNNPTGAMYSKSELRALADVLLDFPDVLVLSDDIYEHVVYDGHFCTMAEAAPELKSRVLTVNGVSKTYAMTGWRLGFAGGPAWLIRSMNTIQSQSTSNPSSISQVAAAAALSEPLDFLAPRIALLRQRRDRLLIALRQTRGLLSAQAPPSGLYIYANCSRMIGLRTPAGVVLRSDLDVADYFLTDAGVAMVPGTSFGLSPYLRLVFSISDDRLDEACERIVRSCARLTLEGPEE